MSNAVCGWQAGRAFDSENEGSASERTIAQNSLEALMKHYPGYSWFVEVRDGLLMIRNYEVDWRGRYCMVRKLGVVQHDYGRLVKEVVRAAGEYLERARLRRGTARPEEMSKTLEGADKYVPMPSGLLVPAA